MDDVGFLMRYWNRKTKKDPRPPIPPGWEDAPPADLIAAGIMVDNTGRR